jgi:predicted amidohydrolase
MSSLRIAAAQSVSIPGDIAANVASHCTFIRAAAACAVDLLVFPELSLCGYELPLLGACTVQADDALLAPIRELAASNAIVVVVGAAILNAANQVQIGTITFFPSGASAIYCKQYLHTGEERFVTAGASTCSTYPIADETFALAICADTAHEQHAQAAAAAGASLYAASVLVSEAGYPVDAGNLQRYAERYGMAILMANHGGPTGGYVSAGKSAFWSAQGQLIVAAPGTGQYLVIATKSTEGWVGELRSIKT